MEKSSWEGVYRNNVAETLPWFSPELDQEIRDFINKNKIKKGKFLDLGTGPGTQAIELAKLGFEVTAVDISQTAIEKAEKRAVIEKVKIQFFVDDILNTKLKPKQFDFIYDRGVFHTFDPKDRERAVKTIRSIIKDNGIYFVKVFSTKTPGTEGPYRFTKEQIRYYFEKDFEILSIKDSVYPGTLFEIPKTLFCVMKPKAR